MADYLYPPTQNGLQKTLDAQLDEGTTSSMTLNNVTGIQNKPGLVLINRIDSNGNEKASSVREFIEYTAVSGNTLTGLTRGIGGSSDQDHAVGSVVEFVLDVTWGQRVIDGLKLLTDNTTTVNTTNVVTPAGSQTLTNKTLTSPVLNTGVSGTAILDEDDLSSDSDTQLATQQSIKAYVDANAGNTDGWTESADTWTYASASSFTIAGVDRTSTYTPGTKLKFTQTSAKYAVVLSSSFSTNTTVNIAVNTDYTVANAAITAPYYSYQTNPQGFPGWFALTAPTFDVSYMDNASGGQPTITETRMRIEGRLVTIHLRGQGTKATSNNFYILSASGFPTPANSTDRFALGPAYLFHSSATDAIGSVYKNSTNLIAYHHVSITDNATVNHFGFTIQYEI